VEAAGLTPVVVEAYFAERRAAGYAGHVTGRALRPRARYLRRLGVIPPSAPVVMANAEERLLTWVPALPACGARAGRDDS
jgi:hypothetical protein